MQIKKSELTKLVRESVKEVLNEDKNISLGKGISIIAKPEKGMYHLFGQKGPNIILTKNDLKTIYKKQNLSGKYKLKNCILNIDYNKGFIFTNNKSNISLTNGVTIKNFLHVIGNYISSLYD